MDIDFNKNETDVPLVSQHLEELCGKNVFYKSLPGNRGDDLIVMGINELLRRHQIRVVDDPSKADHMLIKGGGALIDEYPKLLADIQVLLRKTSSLPTTILPTSYLLRDQSLAELAGPRSALLRIYAREKYSFDLLNQLDFDGPAEIGLDHDTAFHLINSDFMRRLKRKTTLKHILIVERTDIEALCRPIVRFDGGTAEVAGTEITGPTVVNSPPAFGLRRHLPRSVKALKAQFLRVIELPKIERDAIKTPFAIQAIDRIHKDMPETRELPIRAFDVSQNRYSSFGQFATVIAQSAAVCSTRLHVGILSAMLDKPTYLVAGVYHKLRGIYEYSMSESKHVELLEQDINTR